MNRILFIVYSFDCSDKHPVFCSIWRLTRRRGAGGASSARGAVAHLSYLLLNNVFFVWRVESVF